MLWLWRMPSSGMLRRVALVKTDVSEERIASIVRVTISELGTTLTLTSKRSTPQSSCQLLLTFLAVLFLSSWWRRRHFPPKRRSLQNPRDVTPQKTAFLWKVLQGRRFYFRPKMVRCLFAVESWWTHGLSRMVTRPRRKQVLTDIFP
jgi:hypothetical protein